MGGIVFYKSSYSADYELGRSNDITFFLMCGSHAFMQSGIPTIDAVLDSLTDPNPDTRPSAYDAMERLLDAMAEVPLKAMKISPTVVRDDEDTTPTSNDPPVKPTSSSVLVDIEVNL